MKITMGVEIDLKGKVAIVTGSSSGLGRSIAEYLSMAGASVVINYRKEKDKADEVTQNIIKSGRKAICVQADVSKIDDVNRLFDTTDKELGPADILVNNAGIDGKRQMVGGDDPDEWSRVIGINLLGPYYCAREAVQRMKKKNGGVIINVTSDHEFVPWSGYSAYASSKAGLSMFTKTLAQEVAENNIRVISVAPGAIKTPINKDVWGNPDSLRDLLNKVAMPRLGEVDDIGKAVAFLCSDLASYITGVTLPVDGGMLLYPDFKHGG